MGAMTESRSELPADVTEFLNTNGAEFRAALEKGDFEVAHVLAHEGWDAIPEPKSQWEYYPDVIPRSNADMFARAGDVDHAREWLDVALNLKGPRQLGHDTELDRIEARVRLALGDRQAAELLAGTLLELYGRRPLTDRNSDLLPIAQAYVARKKGEAPPAEEAGDGGLPLADGGAASEPADLDAQIERLGAAGSDAIEEDDWRGAVESWIEALTIIPAPRSDWSASTWLYTSIGDAYYEGDQLDEALTAFNEALKCPDASGSPFLWLRLGQTLVDLGHEEPGTRALLAAYMLEGEDIFEEDQKYLTFLSGRVDLDS